MRKLDHPNIIKFVGLAFTKEPLLIVMELATHGSLADYLQMVKRSIRAKIDLCCEAACGLEHIHSKEILHCDIADRNCLFSGGKV